MLFDEFKLLIVESVLKLGFDLGGFLVISINRALSGVFELSFVLIDKVLILFVG